MYVKLAPSWALSSFVNEVLLTIKRRKAKGAAGRGIYLALSFSRDAYIKGYLSMVAEGGH
jgi:hypothetical protein